MHIVTDAGELLGSCHAGGAGADDGDRLAGLVFRAAGTIQPFIPGLVGNGLLDRLDGTGLSSRLSVQASSHGAGQMRPVNSGKLLVECRSRDRTFPVPE
jgi:hypothetical protein